MRRLLLCLTGVCLVLGACSDDDGDDDRGAVTSLPVQTTTPSTTTTEPPTPPPDVIPSDPAQITEEYVEQVLDTLYAVALEATKLTRDAGLVTEQVMHLVEATSTAPSAVERINSLASDAAAGFPGYHDELRAVDTDVVAVIEATPTCVFAEAVFDTSGLVTATGTAEGYRIFSRLIPATEEQRASGLNPTAWALDALPATSDGSVPSERCDTH